MRQVFVDSSFLIAAVDPEDRNHGAAMALKKTAATVLTMTSNHVVGECWTFCRRRFGHAAARTLVDSLRDSERYRIVHADPALEDDALDWLRDRNEREYSFVDAVSFQLMRDRGILDALAFDEDFHAAGFRTLQA